MQCSTWKTKRTYKPWKKKETYKPWKALLGKKNKQTWTYKPWKALPAGPAKTDTGDDNIELSPGLYPEGPYPFLELGEDRKHQVLHTENFIIPLDTTGYFLSQDAYGEFFLHNPSKPKATKPKFVTKLEKDRRAIPRGRCLICI